MGTKRHLFGFCNNHDRALDKDLDQQIGHDCNRGLKWGVLLELGRIVGWGDTVIVKPHLVLDQENEALEIVNLGVARLDCRSTLGHCASRWSACLSHKTPKAVVLSTSWPVD